MELVERLMKDWGVNERQAKGGIGAVLYLVRDQVSHAGFEAVVRVLPEAEAWMASSPEGRDKGLFGMLDDVFKSVAGDSLQAGARMGGHFHSLGISTRLVAPFTKQVLTYLEAHVEGQAKQEVAAVLEQFRP